MFVIVDKVFPRKNIILNFILLQDEKRTRYQVSKMWNREDRIILIVSQINKNIKKRIFLIESDISKTIEHQHMRKNIATNYSENIIDSTINELEYHVDTILSGK